jgi:hypothetical protein
MHIDGMELSMNEGFANAAANQNHAWTGCKYQCDSVHEAPVDEPATPNMQVWMDEDTCVNE